MPRLSVLLALLALILPVAMAGSPISRIVVLMMENHSFDSTQCERALCYLRGSNNVFYLFIIIDLLGWLPGIGDLTGNEYRLFSSYSSAVYICCFFAAEIRS